MLYATMPINTSAQKNNPAQAKSNGDHVAEIQSLNAEIDRLQRSFNHWNTGWAVLTFITILAGIGVFLAQRAALEKGDDISRLDKKVSELQRQDFEENLRAKDVEIGDAKREAGLATSAAAKANERAEILEKENLLLEASIAPRRLNAKQQGELAQVRAFLMPVINKPFIFNKGRGVPHYRKGNLASCNTKPVAT
jgi:hypothetical protein